ncbi:MAG: PEP-CTERM sorting domain-containing protein [Phycisphaerae bacterium]|nr:PEP-CTERM sorting domain-containing protein [Phycisphaerae bacterium]MDD5381390.1 PEP-CTERM sorting domain-containing protein [Phycisphaerae bacterium]
MSTRRRKNYYIVPSLVISILVVMALPAPALCETLTTEILISGTINGEALAGTGTSILNLDNGYANTTIQFTSIPTSFDIVAYGKSWKTKHHPKKPPVFALAANFDDLSPTGYSFETTIMYDGGLGILVNTGQVVPTAWNEDRYELDVQGTYSGYLGGVGIQAFGGRFENVISVPGDIFMTDTEVIDFGNGNTLGLTETGTFTLFSGATLPVDPQFLIFDEVIVSFDPSSGILNLDTQALFVPEPTTLFLFGLGGLLFRRRKRA